MQALTDSAAFWVAIFASLIAVYMLPTLIGLIRGRGCPGAGVPGQPDWDADLDGVARRADPCLRAASPSLHVGPAAKLWRHVRA